MERRKGGWDDLRVFKNCVRRQADRDDHYTLMTIFAAEDPDQTPDPWPWLVDSPSAYLPLQNCIQSTVEPAQTLNPQHLNGDFFALKHAFSDTTENVVATGFDPEMCMDTAIGGYVQPPASVTGGFAGPEFGSERWDLPFQERPYGEEHCQLRSQPSQLQYQQHRQHQQQPFALPQQQPSSFAPFAINNDTASNVGGNNSTTTPIPRVFHIPQTPARQLPTLTTSNHANVGLASLSAILTHLPTSFISQAKAPDPSLQLGKRRLVSLRVYENGEPRFQRKVIRYALQVVQQPIQGKTFADKDRRPIVHPPVLRLWLVESFLANPVMAGHAETLPQLLENESLWLDRVMDVSTADSVSHRRRKSSSSRRESIASKMHEGEDSGSGSSLGAVGATLNVQPRTAESKQKRKREGGGENSASGSRSGRGSHLSSSSHGESVSTHPSSHSSTSSAATRKSSLAAIPAAPHVPLSVPPVNGDVTSTSASPTAAPFPSPPPTRHKRNLFGLWAVSCRKMYGMGAADDLGIWFMFNDISIQQPGRYALRFQCFDLADTQNTPEVASLSRELKVTDSVETSRRESATDVPMQTADGYEGNPSPSQPPLKPPTTYRLSALPTTSKDAQSTAQARALCEVISSEFTVWGGKGMPSWPVGTALTSYFSR
ncbi:hypothetical protein QFC19_001465 [Naganishia cerealis]|uniref:Uncharacterized protein n=1 Tax=Naganishia cerealis TaxID=610337 RepID=A0ACC2WIH5_9TREE|nr:hypothetical protein QFC19_001465 [Naganishia cerealis]